LHEFDNKPQIKIMTTARDTIVDALDIESFVLCARGRERQRRSIIQPGVGACAYPGLLPPTSTTLKGLHPQCESPRSNPFRVAGIFHRTPRVAPTAQPRADRSERRWRSLEFRTTEKFAALARENFLSQPELIL
jgi:hypothetical protein